MLVGVLTGQDRSPAGGAERRRDECVLEDDPTCGESIEAGCLEEGMAEEAESVVALVVDEDEDDVALLRRRATGAERDGARQQEPGEAKTPGQATPP